MQEIRLVGEILRRRWRTFGGVMGTVLGLALLFLLVAPKQYEVEGQLLYQESPLNLLAAGNLLGGALGSFIGVNPNLETQLALLSSLDLFREVSENLPEEDIRHITRLSPLLLPIRWVKRALFPRTPGHPPVLRAAYRLREDLVVEPVGAASVIRVVYQDTDRERALRVVQTYMEHALRFSQRVQERFYRRVARSLALRVQDVQDSLTRVEEALVAFQETTLTFSPEDQAPALFQQVLTLEGLRGEIEGELAGLRAQAEAGGVVQDSLLAGVIDERSLLESPSVRAVWDSLIALRVLYVQLRAQGLADTSHRLQEVASRIERMERLLRESLQGMLQQNVWGHPGMMLDSLALRAVGFRLGEAQLEAQLRVIRRELNRLEDSLRGLPQRALTYLRLRRELEFFQRMWATLEGQRAQMEVMAAAATPAFLVVQQPVIPAEPVSPSVLLVLVASVFLGGMFAVGGVFLRELLEQRVYHPQDAEGLLGVPVVCTLEPGNPEGARARMLAFLLRALDEGARRFLVAPVSSKVDLAPFLKDLQRYSVSMQRPLGLVVFRGDAPAGDPTLLERDPRKPGGQEIPVGREGLRVYESPAMSRLLTPFATGAEGLVLLVPSLIDDPHGYALVRKVDGVLLGVVEETPVEVLRHLKEQIPLQGGRLQGIIFLRTPG